MAELSLRERLQPTLLDRLVDEERMLTLFQISVPLEELRRLGLTEREFSDILVAQGLQAASHDKAHAAPERDAERAHWSLFAPSGRVSMAQLKALVLKPPGAPKGVSLQSFCSVDARNILNESLETSERRFVSPRRLRELVYRDLAALLNAVSFEMSFDLLRYPQVRSSVVNYGMPSLAGISASAVDPVRTGAHIEQAIKRFEPRLQKVRVTPEPQRAGADGHHLAFRIEAELWSQPSPQLLLLRTRIDTESGAVSISDSNAK
jgi:type VI secretion system protein ImpF